MSQIIYNPEQPQPLSHVHENVLNLYTAASGLRYPERLPPDDTARVELDLTNTPLAVYHKDVEKLNPKDFALIRRDGFGGSDTGSLLGVNPFMWLNDLIAQKASPTLSEDELETGEQVAVIKGNDLEPLIIDKFEKILQIKTVKPTDMYVFKEWPFLKMNFDGVTGNPKQYIPVEIKVVTKKGEKHYDPFKAFYIEREGFKALPEDISETNNSIETKAAIYGIPAYYYTQLQDEMMALNAPFGFLCTLWETTWQVYIYFIYKDIHVWNAIKIQGFKAWEQVKILKTKLNKAEEVKKLAVMNQQYGQHKVAEILENEVKTNAFARENQNQISQPGSDSY